MLSHCRTVLLLACLLGPGALVVVSHSWQASDRPADDGWRRTADGWERATQWPSKSSAWFSQDRSHSAARNAVRFDSHPAALALSQLGLVVLGFYAFPSPSRTVQGPALNRWRALLAKSFQASVFGA